MKSQLFIILLLAMTMTTIAVGQSDYRSYYLLANKADSLTAEKHYAEAKDLFEASFGEVEDIHSPYLVWAAFCAQKVNDFQTCSQWLLQAMSTGRSHAILYSKAFRRFRKSEYFKPLLERIPYFDRSSAFHSIIDSLYYIDQQILRQNEVFSDHHFDTSLSYSDSSNFAALLNAIDEFGFPSEWNVGFTSCIRAMVIIHHSARLPENEWYLNILRNKVLSGEFPPDRYAWIVDQSLDYQNQDLIYHHWDVTKGWDAVSIEEKMRINEERRAIGMYALGRYEVKEKNGKRKVKSNW